MTLHYSYDPDFCTSRVCAFGDTAWVSRGLGRFLTEAARFLLLVAGWSPLFIVELLYCPAPTALKTGEGARAIRFSLLFA